MHVVIHDEVDHDIFPKLNSFNCDLGIFEDNIDREQYPDPTDHPDWDGFSQAMDDYLAACGDALDRAKNVSLNLEAGTASPDYWPEYAPYFLVSETTIHVKELALAGKIMEDSFDVAACQKLAGEFYQPGSQPTLP